jgi:cysteine desulfurase
MSSHDAGAQAVRKIFFDHISTTPLDPRVLDAMMPFLTECYGNPSSHIHEQGQAALRAVDRARGEVAALVGAKASEIVFTSGATESNNIAVLGALEASGKRHVVVSEIEHFSVMNALIPLRNAGAEVTLLPVDRNGLVDPDDVRKALRPETGLLSVMQANSEIGSIQPVEEIGRIARERGVTFHVDAASSAGHIPCDVLAIHADLLTLSAHNFYGPKGRRAVLREGAKVASRNFRRHPGKGVPAATENVRDRGMGAAAAIAREAVVGGICAARRRLWRGWRRSAPALHRAPLAAPSRARLLSGSSTGRESLLFPQPERIMAASGSACGSNLREDEETWSPRRCSGDRRTERHLHGSITSSRKEHGGDVRRR